MTQQTWADWSDAALLEHEQHLYDLEFEGQEWAWEARDEVLWEINRRGLTRIHGEHGSDPRV